MLQPKVPHLSCFEFCLFASFSPLLSSIHMNSTALPEVPDPSLLPSLPALCNGCFSPCRRQHVVVLSQVRLVGGPWVPQWDSLISLSVPPSIHSLPGFNHTIPFSNVDTCWVPGITPLAMNWWGTSSSRLQLENRIRTSVLMLSQEQ